MPAQIDSLSKQSAKHCKYAFHQCIQIDYLGADGLLSGECQQLTGDIRRMSGSGIYLRQFSVQHIPRGDPAQSHFSATQDHTQHIVVIVGNAPGETAYGFHLLSL